MTQISQKSFAARLSRGKKFHTFIQNFSGFDPGEEELTAAGLLALLNGLESTQSQHTSAQFSFSEAVKARTKIYRNDALAVSKTVTLVKNYVRGKYNKHSPEYAAIDGLVKNMRGNKPKVVNKNSSNETISQCEVSYGALLQNLIDIVTLVAGFGDAYKPANDNIKLPQLETLKEQAAMANSNAAKTYAAFKPKVKERQDGFGSLAEVASRIKNMVLSQYGADSTEYALVKGLDF